MTQYVLSILNRETGKLIATKAVRTSHHRKQDEADWELMARELCRDAWFAEGRWPVVIEGTANEE